MQRPNVPAYQVAAFVTVVSCIAVGALLFYPVTPGSDPVARLETARAAVALADDVVLLVALGAAVGLAAGSVIGGLWAYHLEVADR